MPEPTARILSHFSLYRLSESFHSLPANERKNLLSGWKSALAAAAPAVHIYQLYPSDAGADLLVWSSLPVGDGQEPGDFFVSFARQTSATRSFLVPTQVLWGFTRPSEYTRTRSSQGSAQEIDPFSPPRKAFLVIYPFVKTTEWYLMSREARQGMMNEHIRIGKQYPEITQLLLYSFGLQDQEFIVAYETDDLVRFSDLVYALRSSEARRFTLRDTPLYTAVYHPAEETLGLWA